VGDAQQLGGFPNLSGDVVLARTDHRRAEREGEILPHRQMRVQGTLLEHHRQVAARRGRSGDLGAADRQLPPIRGPQPGDMSSADELPANFCLAPRTDETSTARADTVRSGLACRNRLASNARQQRILANPLATATNIRVKPSFCCLRAANRRKFSSRSVPQERADL